LSFYEKTQISVQLETKSHYVEYGESSVTQYETYEKYEALALLHLRLMARPVVLLRGYLTMMTQPDKAEGP